MTLTVYVPEWQIRYYLLIAAGFALAILVHTALDQRRAKGWWWRILLIAPVAGLLWPLALKGAVVDVIDAVRDYRSGEASHGWRTVYSYDCLVCYGQRRCRPVPTWLPRRVVRRLVVAHARREHDREGCLARLA